MRISDWSSDVCSSDLLDHRTRSFSPKSGPQTLRRQGAGKVEGCRHSRRHPCLQGAFDHHRAIDDLECAGNALVHRAFALEQPLPDTRELFIELPKVLRVCLIAVVRLACSDLVEHPLND